MKPRHSKARATPSEPLRIRRGDVLWINCDPSVGVEPRKIRTCVVASNDVANEFGAAITVIPTQEWSKERADRAYMVDLRAPRSTMDEPRVANAAMIMTYDRRRVVSRAGKLHAQAMEALDAALKLHLGIEE